MARRPRAPPSRPAETPAQRHTWRIYRVRRTPAEYLGTVEAADEAEAIVKAIEAFAVDARMHGRLLARRVT